jgi:hypothetical protein
MTTAKRNTSCQMTKFMCVGILQVKHKCYLFITGIPFSLDEVLSHQGLDHPNEH